MGDSSAIALGIICLACGFLANQLVVSDTVTTANSTQPVPSCLIGSTDNFTIPVSCSNGRRIAGCCVARTNCNYNTTSTDLTMYGPPGYRSPCLTTDVCCPMKYIIPATASNHNSQEDKLSNDSSLELSDENV